jgi:hypothetical protein
VDKDYKEAFDTLKQYEGKLKKKDFEEKIKALWLGATPKDLGSDKKSFVEYSSPDIKGEVFNVVYDKDGLVSKLTRTVFRTSK